jgi:hypothetical protein
MPAYNELVRPYTRVPDSSDSTVPGNDDKGKGKEVDPMTLVGVNGQPHPPVDPNGATAAPVPPAPMTLEEKRQRTGKHERGWKMFAQRVSGECTLPTWSFLYPLFKHSPPLDVPSTMCFRVTMPHSVTFFLSL